MRIAIIGAGVAGLAAAQRLRTAGLAPVVLDKGRGPGGRTVSKRTPLGAVDLGAQYFTARHPAFREAVARWQRDGVVAEWPVAPRVLPEGRVAAGGPRYLACPRMSMLARHLAEGLDLRLAVRVAGLRSGAAGWTLETDTQGVLGPFDRVLVTAPAPQTRELLEGVAPALAEAAARAGMAPCWSLAVALETPLPALPDAAFVNAGSLGWIARSGSRPGRMHEAECWALHGSPAWSAGMLEADGETVTNALLDALATLAGERPRCLAAVPHRWRYARATAPLEWPAGYVADGALLVAGDWVADGRVEGAWLSGGAAADALLEGAGLASARG
ncbi:NAD(P)/FAD-dependent oxidoreductase [Spiribacter halobius]|uniref:NAD/FAD-dependent oxidoreductase n=1 Tax=Sediminicurvatus halobius TaxID=2182432 RepID=A0A2U2MXW5_9GAMM|nr:FAD-dependent oxidoreductase [Spiribacter halobius]PWG61667.1 NAD/FAD-dependent oxidoreductase [Spiribacter halobius]UEX79434.1 FAD-dependent oxidoreductase [Spiribacter halobius]